MNKGDQERSAGYGALALVVEFLGILAATPLLGYLVDHYLLGSEGPGIGFFVGMVAGFLYGLLHMVRRAKTLLPTGRTGAEAGPRKRNRDGYEADLDGRIDEIRGSLDGVGRRIGEAQNSSGPKRGRSASGNSAQARPSSDEDPAS